VDEDFEIPEPPEPIEAEQSGMATFVFLVVLLCVSIGCLVWADRELKRPLPWPEKFSRSVRPPDFMSGWQIWMSGGSGAVTSTAVCYTSGTGDPGYCSVGTLYNDTWGPATTKGK
jgi:hypothetical protein